MIKILLNTGSGDGVDFHRLILPHSKLKQLDTEGKFGVTFGIPKEVTDKVSFISQYDIFVFNRFFPVEELVQLKGKVKLVCDMDDYWYLNSTHPALSTYKILDLSHKIQECIKLADVVTCTTIILEDKIKPFNSNTYILRNAWNPLKGEVKPDRRLRFGLIGGISHLQDVELLDGVVNALPKDVLDGVKFVLCGFDKGKKRFYLPDGSVREEPMPWEENGWNRFEKILTNNYKTLTEKHLNFLKEYRFGFEMDSPEPYKRVWTKDIYHYMNSYNEIDVLLVPLLDNEFNACKSELKFVEAAAMGKPVICSDVNPYKICGINLFEKGGKINPDGNCIMVDNRKGAKAWVKAITKLYKDNGLRDMLVNNEQKLINETGVYNLDNVTRERMKLYETLSD